MSLWDRTRIFPVHTAAQPDRRSPKTSTALLAIAVFGTILLVVAILFSARERLVENASAAASQHARVMASHTEQSFRAARVLLEVLASDLRGHDLHAIGEDAGRDMLRARVSGALAQVRNMSIMDSDGRQLFLSSDPIVGHIDVTDRDYFRLLKGGATTSASGPYIGRNTAQPNYALAYRIDNDKGEMIGLAHAAIRPEFFQEFCEAVRPAAALQTALVSNSGQVVATCEPGNPFVTRGIEDLPQFQPAAFLGGAVPKLRIEQRLDAYPLRVVVAISGWDTVQAWRWEALSACLSAVLVLVVSAMISGTLLRLYRRKYKRTTREMGLLERRVQERTKELDHAKQQAERANQAKSRFLAAASHDLRQPFQAMLLYREILEHRLKQPENRKVMAALAKSMEAGQELLDALLHISTLEAGVTRPKVESISLQDVLGTLATEFADQAGKAALRFQIVPCSAVVATDPVLLRRMIRNLLTNAFRYTTEGRVLLGARRRSGGAVRIEVWDTGPGIPENAQTDIWEEFTQLHNAERDRSKGLGLGLAIVARTGLLLDHPVSLQSWPGRGSVFRIELGRGDKSASET